MVGGPLEINPKDGCGVVYVCGSVYLCCVCVRVKKCLATGTEGFSETKPCCYFGAVMMRGG